MKFVVLQLNGRIEKNSSSLVTFNSEPIRCARATSTRREQLVGVPRSARWSPRVATLCTSKRGPTHAQPKYKPKSGGRSTSIALENRTVALALTYLLTSRCCRSWYCMVHSPTFLLKCSHIHNLIRPFFIYGQFFDHDQERCAIFKRSLWPI